MDSRFSLNGQVILARSLSAESRGIEVQRTGVGALPGDRLCVIRLDRLRCSLKELLETVDGLKAHGIHLVRLEERLDTSSAAGELVFHVSAPSRTSSAGSSPSEPATASPRPGNAVELRVDRRSTRRRFRPLRNSSRPDCHQASRQTARNRQGNCLQNRNPDALKSESRCFAPLE